MFSNPSSPSQPSLAGALKLTPQARTVLAHLERYGSISPMEALVSYSVGRLGARVLEIRKAGYDIHTEYKRDGGGHPYGRYWLQKRTVN